jgi:hypothetical protein
MFHAKTSQTHDIPTNKITVLNTLAWVWKGHVAKVPRNYVVRGWKQRKYVNYRTLIYFLNTERYYLGRYRQIRRQYVVLSVAITVHDTCINHKYLKENWYEIKNKYQKSYQFSKLPREKLNFRQRIPTQNNIYCRYLSKSRNPNKNYLGKRDIIYHRPRLRHSVRARQVFFKFNVSLVNIM